MANANNKYKYVKIWRKNNPEKDKEHKRLYGIRHRVKLNEKLKEWQKNNRNKTAKYFKNWKEKNYQSFTTFSLRKKTKVLGIKLSFEEYIVLLKKQNNRCAICGKKETAKHKSGSICLLSIDHCHKTKAVRGLLCKKCNSGIGFFKDDVGLIKKAIKYLSIYGKK